MTTPRPVQRPGESPFAYTKRLFAWKREVVQQVKTTPPPALAGGGAPPVPWAQTKAGMDYAHEQQLAAQAAQQKRDAALARKQHLQALARQQAEQAFLAREAERQRAEERRIRAAELARIREENINRLRLERQETFAGLMASGDTVRAVLFAAGYGPESDVFDVRARQLGVTQQELKGASALRTQTEEALSRVLSRKVTIGGEGVRGLGTVIGSARAYMQGGADVRQLLTSAFGVGSLREGERPGMSAARLGELIQQVTPTGVLP